MEIVFKNKTFKPKTGCTKIPNQPVKTHQVYLKNENLPSNSGVLDKDVGIIEHDVGNDSDGGGGSAGTDSRFSTGTSSTNTSDLEDGCEDEGRSYNDYHTSTINGIVLEYLELLGLEETYKTFWSECTRMEIPLPVGIRDPLFRRTKFTEKEVEKFLAHFDHWEGEELINDWSKFSEEVEDNGSNDFRQISILLRIYMASLAFRKNEGSKQKTEALDELREFHQSFSEEFTKDPICLPLFAFPFVSDPTIHPAFKAVFTIEWQLNLRHQLELLFENHLGSHNIYGVSTCDLKQMYHHYIEEDFGHTGEDDRQFYNQVGLDSAHKESSHSIIHKGSITDNPCESSWMSTTVNPSLSSTITTDDSISTLFNQSLSMPDVSSYVKRSLIQTQDRYCKLLSATSAVVTALEQAVQGKAQDIRVLESQLQVSFPELFCPVTPASSTHKPIVYKKVPKPIPVNHLKIPEVKLQVNELKVETRLCIPASELVENVEISACDADTEENSTESDDFSEESESESGSASGDTSGHEGETLNITDCSRSSPLTNIDSTSLTTVTPKSQTSSKSPITLKAQVNSPSKENQKSYSVTHVLKLTDSMANSTVIENAAEWAKNEDQEIPEEFCQYFAGLSSRSSEKGNSQTNFMKNPFLPPSVSEPFPSPPRTYEVSPRSSKIIYIPSSLEVGCSQNSSLKLPEASIVTISSSGDRDRQRQRSETPMMSPNSSCLDRKDLQTAARSLKGTRGKWDMNEKSRKIYEPQKPTNSHKELPIRCLTPPPDRKSTTMASLMGILNQNQNTTSNPQSPNSTSSEGQDQRKSLLIHQASLKRLRNSNTETTTKQTVQRLGQIQTSTISSILQLPPPVSASKLLMKKKYSSEGGVQQRRRIYKLSPTNSNGKKIITTSSTDKGILQVKSFGPQSSENNNLK